MLILTRRISESIIIGNKEVVITILSIRGNQVKISVDASKDISVHREEIYQKIQLQKEVANDEIDLEAA